MPGRESAGAGVHGGRAVGGTAAAGGEAVGQADESAAAWRFFRTPKLPSGQASKGGPIEKHA